MPEAGDTVAGVKLVQMLHADARTQVWRGEADDGAKVGVYVLEPSVSDDATYAFHAGALKLLKLSTKSPVPGVLRLRAVQPDGRAFAADLWSVGNASDLPALSWGMDRRLELMRKICEALEGLHAAGIIHGGLAPRSVLLDDDLKPVIADAALYDPATLVADNARAPYVAPEVEAGGAPTIASDVFATGQLLHFLLLDRDPPMARDELSPLHELAAIAPGGLVRILRKAIAAVPARRYASVALLMADLDHYAESEIVGAPHPDVHEANPKEAFTPGQKPNAAPEPKRAPARPDASAPASGKKPPVTARNPAVRATRATPKEPTPTWTRGAALVGVLLLGVSLLLGYTTGSFAILWRILSAVGFAGLTFALPIPAMKARLVVAGVGVAIGLVVDLGGQATIAGATNLLQSNDPSTAVGAIRSLRSAGATKFTNAMVQGGDLSGMNLDGTDCDWVDFTSANLRNTSFMHASLVAATLKDAHIEGANFSEANVTMIVELESALCDERTKLPSGWTCAEGHPKR